MAKLHEILAVEKTLATAANKLLAESKKTLDKDSLFKGQVRTLTHFSEDDRNQDNVEVQALTTTVGENIEYLRQPWAKWIDTVAAKDLGNMSASANVEVDGRVIAENIPASTLLGLETKLSDFRSVLDKIPTLAPGVNWVADPSADRQGVYKTADPVVTIKEIKDADFRRVAEHTENHPAQIARVDINRPVGRYETVSTSGMISPHDKAAMMTRLDTLLRAVKKARAKANDAKVEKVSIGAAMFDFVVKS